MNAPEVKHPERAEYRFARKAGGAVRGHLVTSNQEATDPLVDVVVDRAIRRQAGAVAEVRRPPPQQAVEPIAHLGPATHIAGYEHSADLRLEPQHALLRRTRAQIPVAVLPVMVQPRRRSPDCRDQAGLFEVFREDLDAVLARSDRAKGGRPPYERRPDVQDPGAAGALRPVGRPGGVPDPRPTQLRPFPRAG